MLRGGNKQIYTCYFCLQIKGALFKNAKLETSATRSQHSIISDKSKLFSTVPYNIVNKKKNIDPRWMGATSAGGK